MAKKYVIVDRGLANECVANLPGVIGFSLRWNKDNTKTFVKYEGYKPKFLYGKTAYTYSQILEILNDVNGEWYIEDTTSE